MASPDDERAYWRANLLLVGILLGIWFTVAFLGGIVFAEALNAIPLGGFKLGFWIAQQGAIVVFVLLILVYAVIMGRLDRRFHVEEPAAPVVSTDPDELSETIATVLSAERPDRPRPPEDRP